ncbi:MAG: D-sedoheptulose 7-phosphate isomerase [Deltaproteobacteria bacterium]|nr:D-sedoheptulose 7-phosphate isomerase [Deltaproteobacteria bacterium]
MIKESLAGSLAAQENFVAQSRETLVTAVEWVVSCFEGGGKLLLFGNGGSAADAQHLAAEFVNSFLIDRRPLPALALTTDTSILTSVGNDFSYDDIFAKQIRALGKKEDLALGISTSGNSANVIAAFAEAKKIGMKTMALTGCNGGKIRGHVDLLLNVPSTHTPHIQETHLWIEHMICQLTDEKMFGSLA